MNCSHARESPSSDSLSGRDELERFKIDINLTECYQLDCRASSRNSVVIRHLGGDKISIGRDAAQHWVDFSVRADTGSIIDCIQHRRRCFIGEVRRKLRLDRRGRLPDGPCGYEISNRGFTGFASGGEKGLWCSAARVGDTALVIAESGTDALAYAVLHPNENARYASTGGAMNPTQPALIRGALEKMG